jgi:hypothetical protein
LRKKFEVTEGRPEFNWNTFLENVRYSGSKIVSVTTNEGTTYPVNVEPKFDHDCKILKTSETEIFRHSDKKLSPWCGKQLGLEAQIVSAIIECKTNTIAEARWVSFGYNLRKIATKELKELADEPMDFCSISIHGAVKEAMDGNIREP